MTDGRPWQAFVFGDWVMTPASVARKFLENADGVFWDWHIDHAGEDPEFDRHLQAYKHVANRQRSLGSAAGSADGSVVGPNLDHSSDAETDSRCWLDSGEVADLLGISEHSVRKWIYAGKLRSSQGDDKRHRIDPHEYLDFLQRYRATRRTT